MRIYQGFCHQLFMAIAIVPVLPIALFLSGCGNIVSETEERIQGRLLLWHPFEGQEAETLDSILNQYRELYPKIRIVNEFFPEGEITGLFNLQS